MNRVKRLKTAQFTQDEDVDMTNWLGFEASQIGACGCRIGTNKKTVYAEDTVCVPSDGIPYASGSILSLKFDGGSEDKRIQIDYTILECCE